SGPNPLGKKSELIASRVAVQQPCTVWLQVYVGASSKSGMYMKLNDQPSEPSYTQWPAVRTTAALPLVVFTTLPEQIQSPADVEKRIRPDRCSMAPLPVHEAPPPPPPGLAYGVIFPLFGSTR